MREGERSMKGNVNQNFRIIKGNSIYLSKKYYNPEDADSGSNQIVL